MTHDAKDSKIKQATTRFTAGMEGMDLIDKLALVTSGTSGLRAETAKD